MSTLQQDISKYIEGLAEHSSNIFWIKSTDFTKQIYISPAYETIWGRSCESMYTDPKSWTDYIFPQDIERLFATVERCRENIAHDTAYIETYRIKRPDGKLFWIEERGFSIYDNADNLIGFGGVAQDITNIKRKERVEAEVQVLSETRDTYEEHLRSIIDSIAGNHWWKDKDGVYRGYNRTLLKSLGYRSSSEIIGKTDYELPWSDQADHLVAHDREVIRRGVAIEREEMVRSSSGEVRIYLVNKAPLRNPNGDIIGTIGHGFDITEMKRAREELEEAQEALERKQGAVEGHLGVERALLCDYWAKDLEGRHLFFNDELARLFGLDSGADVIGKTDYELPWAEDADFIVAYDKEVINTGGKITREMRLTAEDGSLHYLLVTKMPLRNENEDIVGIIANSMDITEQKRDQEALRVAKERAEAQLNKLIEKMEQPVNEEEKQSDSPMFHDYCVLVVEDNVLNQKVTTALLNDLGCRVDLAEDGKEAFKKVESKDYDIIFMDIGLPEMDGVSVAKRLRVKPKTKDAIIVALTAHSLNEEKRRCFDAQMDDVLTKPVSSSDLSKVLTALCQKKT